MSDDKIEGLILLIPILILYVVYVVIELYERL